MPLEAKLTLGFEDGEVEGNAFYGIYSSLEVCEDFGAIYGLCFGLGNMVKGEINGLALGLFGNSAEKLHGISLGIFENECEEAIGLTGSLINYIKNFKGFALAGVNVIEGTIDGVALALANYADKFRGLAANIFFSKIREMKGGLLSGIYAYVEQSFDGLMVAPICVGPEKGKYLQVGIICARKQDDGSYKYTPGIGFNNS
jgi:hypothetical protein